MAEVHIIRVVDDIDNALAADTRRYFGLDGKWYRIDLTMAHAAELDEAFLKYARLGLHVSAEEVQDVQFVNTSPSEIAKWAEDNGHKVTRTKSGQWYIPVKTRKAFMESRTVNQA
jgi:hypothetical protein